MLALEDSPDRVKALVDSVERALGGWPEADELRKGFLSQLRNDQNALVRYNLDRIYAGLEYESEVLHYLTEVSARMGPSGVVHSLRARAGLQATHARMHTVERNRAAHAR